MEGCFLANASGFQLPFGNSIRSLCCERKSDALDCGFGTLAGAATVEGCFLANASGFQLPFGNSIAAVVLVLDGAGVVVAESAFDLFYWILLAVLDHLFFECLRQIDIHLVGQGDGVTQNIGQFFANR